MPLGATYTDWYIGFSLAFVVVVVVVVKKRTSPGEGQPAGEEEE